MSKKEGMRGEKETLKKIYNRGFLWHHKRHFPAFKIFEQIK